MKNVLYDLQLSMVDDYNDGKFIFTEDSNVNVAVFTLNGLARLHPTWNFYLMIPFFNKIKERFDRNGKKLENIEDYFTDKLEKNIQLVLYDYYGFPFLDRMHFNVKCLDYMTDLLPKMDLLLLNDPTKVLAYKSFFYNKQKQFLPIISRNHWVSGKADRKVPEEIDFFLRQLEGSIYGTYSTFNSQYAKRLFLENAEEFLNKEKIAEIEKKCFGFDTVDAKKLDKYETKERFEKFTILWGHRLSYYTGWKETFDALLEVWNKRQDFQVIATDQGNKTTQKELHRKYPFVVELFKERWTHENYMNLCWKADLVIGNHKYPATWGGLSITEPMCCGAIPLLHDDHAYPEMFYYDRHKDTCFFKDEQDMIRKLEIIMNDKVSKELLSNDAKEFARKELSMNNYIAKLDCLINKAIF
jgi:hypothetical protein